MRQALTPVQKAAAYGSLVMIIISMIILGIYIIFALKEMING